MRLALQRNSLLVGATVGVVIGIAAAYAGWPLWKLGIMRLNQAQFADLTFDCDNAMRGHFLAKQLPIRFCELALTAMILSLNEGFDLGIWQRLQPRTVDLVYPHEVSIFCDGGWTDPEKAPNLTMRLRQVTCSAADVLDSEFCIFGHEHSSFVARLSDPASVFD